MLIGIIILAVLSAVLYSFYVRVIKAKNALKEALSGIDVQLEKRHTLLPNILEVAKKFMKHEKDVFTDITKLRTQAVKAISGSAEKFKAETELEKKLAGLVVSVENYPQLKSNETMLEVIRTYHEVEGNVAAARRFYNAALRQLNDVIMIFPGTLFKKYAGDVSKYAYFEANPGHKKPVKVSMK